MTNKQIANQFKLLADLMELHDENPFKIRSYRTAYQNLRRVGQDLSQTSMEDRVDLPGIGKAINAKIDELIQFGSMAALEKMLDKTADGIVELLRIKGLGPKKIKRLWKDLGVESAVELLHACQENRLVQLKGFGDKSQATIAAKLIYFLDTKGSHLYARVEEILGGLTELVGELKLDSFRLVGDAALQRNVVETIDFLYQGDLLDEELLAQKGFTEIRNQESEQMIIALHQEHYTVRFFRAKRSSYAVEYLKRNSSKEFWNDYRDLLPADKDRTIEELEAQLGISHIAIPCREFVPPSDFDYESLVEMKDIRGVIHNHSTYSDGSNTLRQMAETVRDMSYEYLVITDHSQAAFYANGMKEEKVLKQWEEIDHLNSQMDDFQIIKGIEVDILNDGRLDYPEELLSGFELVIASIHSNLQMDKTKATQRLIKAIEHPRTHILGHMTGRLLLAREGYPVDHQMIIDACAANAVSIEINANPYRLDIDWSWIPVAQDRGVQISINPDAHHVREISNIRYGLICARKGLLKKNIV